MKSLVFLFLIFITSHVFAQDLIVKNNGDSLNCLITRNENSYMYFNQIVNHRFKRDSLSLAHIKTFKVDYYNFEKPEIEHVSKPKVIYPTQNKPNPKTVAYSSIKIPHQQHDFFVSINSGFGFRLKDPAEKYGSSLKEYYEDLYAGVTWGAEGAYFFNENLGVGLRFSSYSSSNKTQAAVDSSGNGTYVFGEFSNSVSIKFLGPTFYYRKYSQNEKSILLGHASLGNTIYSNDVDAIIIKYTETGNNLTLSIGATYQFMVDKNFSIGASANYHLAIINQLTYDDGVNKFSSSLYPEDVSRIDLKALLAYWF